MKAIIETAPTGAPITTPIFQRGWRKSFEEVEGSELVTLEAVDIIEAGYEDATGAFIVAGVLCEAETDKLDGVRTLFVVL